MEIDILKYLFIALIGLLLFACAGETRAHETFADYPGFKEFYAGRCKDGRPIPFSDDHDKELLQRYSPRLILPPGGRYPIDFYRDYLPYTLLRRYKDKAVIKDEVTQADLRAYQEDTSVYLDLDKKSFLAAGLDQRVGERGVGPFDHRKPVVNGRVYREKVELSDEQGQKMTYDLIFLKYNVVFAISGLPAELPGGLRALLWLAGLDPDDWHELDNFVAIHIVLDDTERPVAIILAQHNHHRSYVIGKDIPLPEDGHILFDGALRSNEIYPASDAPNPIRHRVVPWSIYMKYLLSGEDPPFTRGEDVTYGVKVGGIEVKYDLAFLSPCDPFYTAKIMLGEPRPFFGKYIGRDGPPGADYYNIPELLPMGNMLKFSYLHDGDPEDIKFIEKTIDLKSKKMEIEKIMEYGGRKLYRDLIDKSAQLR